MTSGDGALVDTTATVAMTAPIRFLVSDVDGTLVTPDKVVTPAARDAVRALHDAGIGFAFVSSRPPKGLAGIAQALALEPVDDERPAAAAFNGGALLNAALRPLSFRPLGDDDARTTLALFAELCIDAWVFTLDRWLLVDPAGHYVAHERDTVGFEPTIVASLDGIEGVGKIVGASPDPALLERARTLLAPRLSADAHAALSQTYYLDVTHAEANKGNALRAIAAHAGLSLERMAAIGDMTNDLAMLEIAGYSIAMGNAPESVQRACDAVTASNRDEGFAEAVRTLVLPRSGDQTMTQEIRTTHRRSVEVVPDATSLATRAAEWLIEQIRHAVDRRGRAVIALSGGSTPKAVFALLAEAPWRDRIEWAKVHVFWGDDRFVAAGDAASNERMARESLLDHVDIPASHVYAIPRDEQSGAGGEDALFERARTAAALYATTLHAFNGGDRLDDAKPLFDVVLLGIGDDGHTASLFPGGPELDERSAWVVPSRTTNPPVPVRVTLTYPALESTHAALFLAAGAGKQDMVRRVLDGDEALPAARLSPVGGTLWILDEAAAGRAPSPRAPH